MTQKQWEFFRILAISSCIASLASVILLAVCIPLIYIQIEEENEFIGLKAKQFRENSERIWTNTNYQNLERNSGENERKKRAVLNVGGICSGKNYRENTEKYKFPERKNTKGKIQNSGKENTENTNFPERKNTKIQFRKRSN
ncbi:unnamed protein product [Meloidogyne enterolobii]|uniref:Uncharacterized protein n=1 Tax=Meloidogyne enterolobii TaxID=390850 RepID=A0ACB0YEP4_MELEN